MGTSTDNVTSSGLFEDITNELTGKVRKNGVVQQATIGSLLAGPLKDVGLGFLVHLYRKNRKTRGQISAANIGVESAARTQDGASTQRTETTADTILE